MGRALENDLAIARKERTMNLFMFHYQLRDVKAFEPKTINKFYDIERALDRRYRSREVLLMWRSKLSQARTALLSWEGRLFHHPRPLAHAHVKPLATRRGNRK